MDPDRDLARLARLQHGVVDRHDAGTLGLTDAAIHRRLRSGRLVPVHPGVYALPGGPDTWHQRLLSACRAAGRGAVAPHRSAAALWRLLEGEELEVTVRRSKGPTPVGVVVHRSRDLLPGHSTTRASIPVTNPLRTMVDLGAVVSDRVVAHALERGVVANLFSVAALEWVLAEVAKPGRRGCGGLRRVLDDRALGAARPDSVLEPRMARLLRTYGFPAAAFQHVVADAEARVDFAYPERRLAIEVDGFEVHGPPRRWRPTTTGTTAWWRRVGRSCGSHGGTSCVARAPWLAASALFWTDLLADSAHGSAQTPGGRRYQPRRSRSQTSTTSSARARNSRSW